MIKLFSNPKEIETNAKKSFNIPDFLMMEHAANGMANFIMERFSDCDSIFIFCGKGNNGADGYALARLLLEKKYSNKIFLFQTQMPCTNEGKIQYEMCFKLGIKTFPADEFLKIKNISQKSIIVDCLFGIGFKGNFDSEISNLLIKINKTKCIKIACDCPSGLNLNGFPCENSFIADFTISMGTNKLCFYSDEAKNLCGKILNISLGLPEQSFYGNTKEDAFLIESNDIKLPYRKNANTHKGKFGHTCVFCGEKGGAGILAASSSIKFGSGLTSILINSNTNLSQFKINPEIMLCNSIPAKTTCIIAGPGFLDLTDEGIKNIFSYFNNPDKKPKSAVFDAGIITSPKFIDVLKQLSSIKDNQIVLTPHLLEFNRFCTLLENELKNLNIFTKDYDITSLSNNVDSKINVAKAINTIFPNITLVIKSSNTFIAQNSQIFIMNDGNPCLSKGGSGDILCGIIGSLLSQGYSSLEAAITGCEVQGILSQKIGSDSFSLTQEKILSTIDELF